MNELSLRPQELPPVLSPTPPPDFSLEESNISLEGFDVPEESQIEADVRPSPDDSSADRSPSFSVRLAFILGFILFLGGAFAFTPQIAQQIAYSWNLGAEQAKARVAKEWLQSHPHTDQRIAWVAKAVTPSVVGIHVIASKPPERYTFSRGERGHPEVFGTDIGSGVIIDPEGYIVTNEHVIAQAHSIEVVLSDGRRVDAELVGRDKSLDIAVLRIHAEGIESIEWGDSQQLSVGEQVAAIGSPYDLHQTVTAGIISATERFVSGSLRRSMRSYPLLQTDAVINPGNSGGALVDMNGKLVGICTSIISEESHGNSGIGFAIPSATARRIVDEIIKHGKSNHGWIGARLENVTLFDLERMKLDKPQGAVVVALRQDAPARIAGLQRNDIILRWGETSVNNPLHLIHLITLTPAGTTVPVEVFREGEGMLTLEITVGSRPVEL